MPKSLSDIRNYPFSQGTTQATRVIPALQDEDYVKLDERQIEDFLMFSQKFAAYIKYYNLNNQVESSWYDFLPSDVSYQIAQLSNLDLKAYGKVWQKLSEKPETGGIPTDDDYKLQMTYRFDFLYKIIHTLADAYVKNSSYDNYSQGLLSMSRSADIGLLHYLVEGYYQKALTENLIITAPYESFVYGDTEIGKTKTFKRIFEKEAYASFLEFVLIDPIDTSILTGTATTVQDKIQNALEYQNMVADALLKILGACIHIAQKYFIASLENYAAHKPHVALFLSFLKLQDEFKDQYNSLLEKHLDFYYKDVLKIKNKAYTPAEVHVFFELAKNQSVQLLAKGSRLSAGKDSKGKEVFYEIQEQLVVNRAQVGAIKSFVQIEASSPSASSRPQGMFAATEANSKDGIGGPLADKEAWVAFGTDNNAAMGFSFSSPLMREIETPASYAVYITFETLTFTPQLLLELNKYLYVEVHTEQKTEPQKITTAEFLNENHKILKIPFTTVNGSSSKSKIVSEGPSASVKMKANSVDMSGMSILDVFGMLSSAHISKIEVELQNQVVEAFLVDTPLGQGNAKEGFFPFGSNPRTKNSFLVSSALMKQRNVKSFSFKGELKEKATKLVYLDAYKDATQESNNEHFHIEVDEKNFEVALVNLGANHSGAVKMFLNGSLGHETYVRDFTIATILKQDDPSASITFPSEPYTPFFKKCELKITVSEQLTLQNHFYHAYPFGYKPTTDPLPTLVPLIENEGELYIGIKDGKVAENFSILFELNEGSANPDLEAAHTKWYYLVGNSWAEFAQNQLIDGTDKLTKSGVVRGSWPLGVDQPTTLFEHQFFWLKVTADQGKVDAVCDIIGLHTQATTARFINTANDIDYLGKNIEGDIITALTPKLGAIKTVKQPYQSFNGQKKESDDMYYLRVSERLRHKKRGVTSWDMEHLLIQEFPELYKVKCLIHACKDPIKGIIAQPGSILVVVLPYSNDKSDNKFMPKVNVAVLRKVTAFLKQKISPFINVNIVNADFEEVRLTIECVFREEIKDRGFYQDKLLSDLHAYLAPWTVTENISDFLFGKGIYKAAVLDYVEELDYVDYITRFELKHGAQNDKDEAYPLSPIGLLTSAATHNVTAYLASEVEYAQN